MTHSLAEIGQNIELAKQFSGDESYRFVNGVLGNVADALQKQRQQQTESAPTEHPHV